MTDKEWKKQMDLCIKYHNKYYNKLLIIEKEYKKRYGKLPSDIDDDVWIDTFHIATDSGGVCISDTVFNLLKDSIKDHIT